MKNKIIIALVLLGMVSCAKDQDNFAGSNRKTEPQIIILQEGNIVDTKAANDEYARYNVNNDTPSLQSARVIDVDDYVGLGYKIGNSIMGDVENVCESVIDLAALRADHPTWILSKAIKKTDISVMSFASAESFERKLNVSQMVKTGFKLNLGLFSIGRENEIKRLFSSHVINKSRTVMGEVSVEVRENSHSLNNLNDVNKQIASQYVHPDLKRALYFNTIDDVMRRYGDFVITDYYTGGRATANYIYTENSDSSVETREQNMTKALNASFSWKGSSGSESGSGSVSGNIGFGDGFLDSSVITNENSNYFYTVKANGGSKDLQVETQSTAVGAAGKGVNLSAWVSSLNNPETHIFTGLKQAKSEDEKGGLTPLSTYFLEENFQRRVQDTHLRYISTSSLNTSPFIEIMKVFIRQSSTGEELFGVAPVLNTRHGDKIVLWNDVEYKLSDDSLRKNNLETNFMRKATALSEIYKNFFSCRIQANLVDKNYPHRRAPILTINFKDIDMSRMVKFVMPATKMTYIVDIDTNCGFAIYNSSVILNAYGIRNWLNQIPEDPYFDIDALMYSRVVGL